MRQRSSGFTLVELMIVVAIVAILAAIAYPAYGRYVEKARRADGKAALLDAAQRLERCHTQFNAYDNAACAFAATSPDGHYAITVVRDAMTFTLTATPQGVQASSPCGTYTLDHTGARTAEGTAADRCW